MRSENALRFNHDDLAFSYDQDVLNESDPIRESYSAVLKHVADVANRSGGNTLDLGCGTGNLGVLLNKYERLTCVDISKNMIDVARTKLSPIAPIEFQLGDLLEFVETQPNETYDTIVSTYAIHHLNESEKIYLFKTVRDSIKKGGKAVFGDLMFRNERERNVLLNSFREKGYNSLVNDINDEFFWNIEISKWVLESQGGKVSAKRFSDLSWVLEITY